VPLSSIDPNDRKRRDRNKDEFDPSSALAVQNGCDAVSDPDEVRAPTDRADGVDHREEAVRGSGEVSGKDYTSLEQGDSPL
jgi:hypothetical protein